MSRGENNWVDKIGMQFQPVRPIYSGKQEHYYTALYPIKTSLSLLSHSLYVYIYIYICIYMHICCHICCHILCLDKHAPNHFPLLKKHFVFPESPNRTAFFGPPDAEGQRPRRLHRRRRRRRRLGARLLGDGRHAAAAAVHFAHDAHIGSLVVKKIIPWGGGEEG